MLYFLQAAGGAPILPFLPVILKQLGVSGAGFGFGLALIGITGIVSRPFTASLIDKYKNCRALCFKILIFGAIVGFGAISQIPSLKEKESRPILSTYGCDDAKSIKNDNMWLISSKGVEDVCTLEKLRELKALPISCEFRCEDKLGNSIGAFHANIYMSTAQTLYMQDVREPFTEDDNQDKEENKELLLFETSTPCSDTLGSRLSKCGLQCPTDIEVTNMLMLQDSTSLFTNVKYWMIIFCWMMGAVCISSIAPIQDTFCHQILNQDKSKERKDKETFGQQRLFASLGWGSFAFVSGYLIRYTSEASIYSNYTSSFVLMAILWGMSAYTTGKLGLENEGTEKEQQPEITGFKNNSKMNENIGRNFTETLTNLSSEPRYASFLCYVVVAGSCLGCMNIHFLLLDELGQKGDCTSLKAIKFLQGLCIAIQCTGELPIFRFSGHLIDKLGTQVISYIVLLAYFVRFSWYGLFMTSPWQTVYVELIHGLCIGLFFPLLTFRAMAIANDLKKKEKGSETAIMGLVYSAHDLGVALGGWTCGVGFEKYGAATTFQLMSYFVLFMLLLHFLSNRLLR